MKHAALLLLAVNLAGCSSIFGDTFSDRAMGYQDVETAPRMQQIEGQPALPIQDILVVPKLSQSATPVVVATANENNSGNIKEGAEESADDEKEFVVPSPQALVIDDSEQEVASLLDSQSKDLNPRLERDGAGTQILRMDGRYAVTWAAIADAISKTDYQLSDLNRSTGTYYVTIFDPVAEKEEKSLWAWLTNSDELGEYVDYLLKLNRSRLGVYLSLQTDLDTLAEDELAIQVLSEIEKNLSE